MTDRFADGDASNDGPDAKSSSSSADGARGKEQRLASMTVPLDQTWMSGCQIDKPDVATGGSSVLTSGSDIKLRIEGDDVLIAACP